MTKTNKYLQINASEVQINTTLLATDKGKKLIESFKNVESSSINKSNNYIAQSVLGNGLPEECDIGSIHDTNQFLQLLSCAFNLHKPIVLKPDYLWLLICQGFAEHIKTNSLILKNKILKINQKAKIKIRRDDFVKGEENPWEEAFPEFVEQLNKIVKGNLSENIVLEFTTSTINEKIAFEVAFMDSMSNFVEYVVISLCGIPKIEIQGTIQDYEKMISNLTVLKKYNLAWWIDKIIPIIEEIINTLKGNINRDFWKSIFKEDDESGGPDITGWITKFFPYIKVEKGLSWRKKVKYKTVKNPLLFDKPDVFLKLGDFPSGISKVPFKWEYLGESYKMDFMSGFIGIKENPKTNFLESEINWIVSENKS